MSARLKLAIVTAFPSDVARPRGGVEAVSMTLGAALGRYPDLDVHIVTMDRSVPVVQRSQWQGAMLHRLPWRGRRMLTAAIGAGRRLLRQYIQELAPAVIHAHDVYGLMAMGLRGPRVLTIHGFIHADTRVSGGPWPRLRGWLWQRLETKAWREYPHIISISPYVRERLRAIATGMIHDVDNPIPEAFFELVRDERPMTVFSAALIGHRKNTLGLIDSFARALRGGLDGELRLAGPVLEPRYGDIVKERIRAYGLDDRVILLGALGTDQVRQEFARASVFALLSFEEGAPLGIAEAMAAGIPVLTSNRCGMPYMVRHGETGFLVDPTDAVDTALHLRLLLENEGLRKRMGERAQDVARERFHPHVVARRTRDIYLRAASSHSR